MAIVQLMINHAYLFMNKQHALFYLRYTLMDHFTNTHKVNRLGGTYLRRFLVDVTNNYYTFHMNSDSSSTSVPLSCVFLPLVYAGIV